MNKETILEMLKRDPTLTNWEIIDVLAISKESKEYWGFTVQLKHRKSKKYSSTYLLMSEEEYNDYLNEKEKKHSLKDEYYENIQHYMIGKIISTDYDLNTHDNRYKLACDVWENLKEMGAFDKNFHTI